MKRIYVASVVYYALAAENFRASRSLRLSLYILPRVANITSGASQPPHNVGWLWGERYGNTRYSATPTWLCRWKPMARPRYHYHCASTSFDVSRVAGWQVHGRCTVWCNPPSPLLKFAGWFSELTREHERSDERHRYVGRFFSFISRSDWLAGAWHGRRRIPGRDVHFKAVRNSRWEVPRLKWDAARRDGRTFRNSLVRPHRYRSLLYVHDISDRG